MPLLPSRMRPRLWECLFRPVPYSEAMHALRDGLHRRGYCDPVPERYHRTGSDSHQHTQRGLCYVQHSPRSSHHAIITPCKHPCTNLCSYSALEVYISELSDRRSKQSASDLICPGWVPNRRASCTALPRRQAVEAIARAQYPQLRPQLRRVTPLPAAGPLALLSTAACSTLGLSCLLPRRLTSAA